MPEDAAPEPKPPKARRQLFTHFHPLPILRTLRGYRRGDVLPDARAGLNVALLTFPQGMAYAAIAGVPIQYGIYGAAVASVIGPLFSASRFIVLGPTNATSALLFGAFLSMGLTDPATRAALLPMILLLAGLFLLAGALLGLANLIQYVSRSVVSAYITAAACYIIVNQIRKVFGFDVTLEPGSSFLDLIYLTALGLARTHWPTLVLSLVAGLLYLALQRVSRTLPNVALTLVIMAALGAFWIPWVEAQGWGVIGTHRAIDATQWGLTWPQLHGVELTDLAFTALVVAFLSVLEGTSIGKSLAARAGARLNPNQEMWGMAAANLSCAVLQGQPASGSLTRSQLNADSGARTPLATVFCGLLVAGAAFSIGPFTRYIPTSVLAVLVIAIGLSLINVHVLRVVWRTTRSDRIVFLTTLLSALFLRLDFAIILGAGLSVLLFLRQAAQPELIEYTQDDAGQFKPLAKDQKERLPEVTLVHVEGELFFGATELFRDQLRRLSERPHVKIIILKLRNAHHLDATSILALEELTRYLQGQERHLLISEARPEALRRLQRSGLTDLLGSENIFADDLDNPTLSSSLAIRRSIQLLDGQEADIKIFLGRRGLPTGEPADAEPGKQEPQAWVTHCSNNP